MPGKKLDKESIMKKPSKAQKEKAQARRAALRELWGKVSEMTPQERAAMVENIGTVTTCEGHPLTVNNAVLLLFQRDDVSVIGGYKQWKAQGRQVRKGEHSLGIWIPSFKKKEDNQDPTGPDYFIFGNVFDITQTDPITA